jgi:excisionase family DNA binding protein
MTQNSTPHALPRLLTLPDVAKVLGVCTRSVRRLIERGEIPVHRVGRLIRITETDLHNYIRLCRN